MQLKSYWFNSTTCLPSATYLCFMRFNYSGNFQDFYFLITFCHILSYQNSLGFGQMLHKTQITKITHKVTAHFQHKVLVTAKKTLLRWLKLFPIFSLFFKITVKDITICPYVHFFPEAPQTSFF